MAQPHKNGEDALRHFLAHLQALGAMETRELAWVEVLFGSRTKIQLSAMQACIGCGEPAAAAVRRDRHGLPYLVHGGCFRVFLRSEYALRTCLGWTRWLGESGHAAAWTQAYEEGERVWRGWLDVHRIGTGRNGEDVAAELTEDSKAGRVGAQ